MEIEKIRPLQNENPVLRFPIQGRVPSNPIPDILPSRKISFHRGSSPVKRRWRLMAWSLAAGTIDLLMMLSVSCFAIGAVIFAMGWKVSFQQILGNSFLASSTAFYLVWILCKLPVGAEGLSGLHGG
jgi:hypothetical protein